VTETERTEFDCASRLASSRSSTSTGPSLSGRRITMSMRLTPAPCRPPPAKLPNAFATASLPLQRPAMALHALAPVCSVRLRQSSRSSGVKFRVRKLRYGNKPDQNAPRRCRHPCHLQRLPWQQQLQFSLRNPLWLLLTMLLLVCIPQHGY